MSDINSALDNLIEAMLESSEYNNFQTNLDRIRRYPEIKQRVDEFRMRNFELQQSDIDPGQLMAETDRFQWDYDKLRSDPMVHDFLASELAFCRMMQLIFDRIMDNVDFD